MPCKYHQENLYSDSSDKIFFNGKGVIGSKKCCYILIKGRVFICSSEHGFIMNKTKLIEPEDQ